MKIKLAREGVRDALLLCLIMLFTAAFAGSAEARRAGRAPQQSVIVCNDRGCSDASGAHAVSVSTVLASSVTAPSRYIAGRLVCAVNVNAALAERGIRGTGSAMAKSFLNWGHASGPVPGAVAVYHRGGRKSRSGHVAIVSRVENGVVYVMNPGRRGWREVAYPRRAIAYRIAS